MTTPSTTTYAQAAASASVPTQVQQQQPVIITAADYASPESVLKLARGELSTYGDQRQAGEKAWLAVDLAMKSLFVACNVSHDCLRNHGNKKAFADFLAYKFSDPKIRSLFYTAKGLHANFYEGTYSEQDVEDSLAEGDEFIGILGQIKNVCEEADLDEFIAKLK